MPVTPGAGIHPDLLDDAHETPAPTGPGTHPDLVSGGTADSAADRNDTTLQTPSQEAPNGAETGAEPTEDQGARNTPDVTEGETPAPPPETPSWLESVRGAKDPAEALAVLTANLSKEEIAKDRRLSGIIGELGQRRAKELLAQSDQQQRERAAAEAAQRGDYYALGELAAPEVLQRIRDQAAQQSFAPFMEGVAQFQASLPMEVQAEVGGRNWPGATPAEQVANYLNAVAQSAIKHGLVPEVEREIKRREPSIRKQVLTDAYGQDLSPELQSGTPAGVREITDEQIGNMSLEEYNEYFDEFNQPKKGVQVRYTRAEPIVRR